MALASSEARVGTPPEPTSKAQTKDEDRTMSRPSSDSGAMQDEKQSQTPDAEAAAPKPPANPGFDPKSFPDGGLEAWTCVLGAFMAIFVSFGWINCIGIFQNYYQENQLSSYSPSDIAWIPSLETFMMFVGGPFVGKLYDNYGPRYLLLTGTFFHVFGLMMTSLCKEYYQFILAQGICSPFGASLLFYPAVSALSTWFFRKRASAVGIAVSGSSLGGVVLPIMVQRLIPRIGFGWTIRATAFLILGCLIITNLTIKSRLPPVKKPFKFMDFVEPFKELTFVLLCFAGFFTFWGIFLPFTYIIIQAQANGMAFSLAQYLVPILNATSIFGRILPGFFGDIIGRYNMMILMVTLTAVITLALWVPASSSAALIVYAAVYGFGSGAVVSLPPAMIAQISDVRKIGTRTGTLFFVISWAALTGSPIGGAIVTDHHGQYRDMKLFSGIVILAGCAFFTAARISLGGWKVTTKV